jgi:hypothetical protein
LIALDAANLHERFFGSMIAASFRQHLKQIRWEKRTSQLLAYQLPVRDVSEKQKSYLNDPKEELQ